VRHTGWTRELNGVPAALFGGLCDCCVNKYALANGIWFSREAEAASELEAGL
jgi:hypothetical protein